MLVPCSSCGRHVREPLCPFCGGSTHETQRPCVVRGVSRATQYAMTAALAAGLVTACATRTSGVNVQAEEAPVDLPHPPDASAPDVREAAARTVTVDEDQQRELFQRQQFRHRQCSPSGQCPPYGGAFPDVALV